METKQLMKKSQVNYINVNKYDEPCVYDFRSLGEDEELIRG